MSKVACELAPGSAGRWPASPGNRALLPRVRGPATAEHRMRIGTPWEHLRLSAGRSGRENGIRDRHRSVADWGGLGSGDHFCQIACGPHQYERRTRMAEPALAYSPPPGPALDAILALDEDSLPYTVDTPMPDGRIQQRAARLLRRRHPVPPARQARPRGRGQRYVRLLHRQRQTRARFGSSLRSPRQARGPTTAP